MLNYVNQSLFMLSGCYAYPPKSRLWDDKR